MKVIDASSPKKKDKISGYQIIDTSILSDAFKLDLCLRFLMSKISLSENVSEKQGLTSL